MFCSLLRKLFLEMSYVLNNKISIPRRDMLATRVLALNRTVTCLVGCDSTGLSKDK